VTAEPYFAVSQPSDVVVMENIVRDDTRGKVEVVYAKYELLKRGTYLLSAGNLTSEGFGESQPVATNGTAEGRQQNRRVELVISGESIASTDTQGSPLALNR
jgi:hypothetical protein